MNRLILSMLTLGLSLASIFSGCAAEPNADQARAIADIEKLGGKVTIDESSPDKPVKSVDLMGTSVTDAGLVYLKGLTKLQLLNLTATKVTDAALEHLKGLKKLQSLSLMETEITDTGLEHLKGLTKLKWLSLVETKVTDAGVKGLQKVLPNCSIVH